MTFSSSITAAGVLILLVVMFLMEHTVLARVERLNSDVKNVSQSDDISMRVQVDGRDEVSYLGTAINQMLKGLEKTQKTLSSIII